MRVHSRPWLETRIAVPGHVYKRLGAARTYKIFLACNAE